jgi:hypothetical protein
VIYVLSSAEEQPESYIMIYPDNESAPPTKIWLKPNQLIVMKSRRVEYEVRCCSEGKGSSSGGKTFLIYGMISGPLDKEKLI